MGVLVLAALSCEASYLLPTGGAFPSPAPGVFETIVAGTAGAAQTQTAALMPATATLTLTPTTTRTATPTATFTPTFVFQLRSPTPRNSVTPTLGSTSGKFACTLLDQDPADGTRLAPETDFDAVWEVRNTGSAAWDSGSIDLAYVSGRKMHKRAVYDLSKDVNKGQSVALVVDMVAPKDSGTYKVVWTLRRGGNDFCHVNLTIQVR